MNRYTIHNFIKRYSSEVSIVNRLFLSAFFLMHEAKFGYNSGDLSKKNSFFLPYIIQESDQAEYSALLDFISLWRQEKEVMNLEDLIQLFEYVVSPSDRIINGAIYTPKHVREYIVKGSLEKYRDNINPEMKVVDIACGCGGFLVTIAQLLKEAFSCSYKEIFKKNIYGLDIQAYSVERTKILLALLMIEAGEEVHEDIFHIFCGDSLIFDWKKVFLGFEGFDIIVGNPPYVCARNLDETTRNNIAHWSVACTGNTDLYIPFFQIGMENLREGGVLGFITMNTFFKSLNGRALRAYFQQEQYAIEIFDFRTYQIFPSRSTYTCICFIEKAHSNQIIYHDVSHGDLVKIDDGGFFVPYQGLDAVKGWNLRQDDIITQIEGTGVPFGKKYRTRHGIATLKNDVYIFSPIAQDDMYFFLEKDGKKYPIEREICKKVLNANRIHKQDPDAIEFEQLIFPYTSDVQPRLLAEIFFQKTFPKAYSYLLTQRNILATRDKGDGKYETWFAFGRTQSLHRVENKLFFPKMTNKSAKCLIISDSEVYFYNGQAVIGYDETEMRIIKKILESELFWYYIQNTSKPYASEYYSLNGAYIAHFGMCDFSEKEKTYLLAIETSTEISNFLHKKYGLT